MTIKEIKAAINHVITQNGGTVYSNETDEGYEKPAFFVRIVPITVEQISPVYEEVTLSVEIHYEPEIFTDEECMRVAELIDTWFDNPIQIGERQIHPPETIQHTTEDDITLYSTFSLSICRVKNEDQYNDDENYMEILESNLNC